MNNWKEITLLSAAALLLAGCGAEASGETAAPQETTTADTSVQIETVSQEADNEETETYENLLAQGREEFEAGYLDAAGGTIALLLGNDLSEYTELANEALHLQQEIIAAQAEAAQEEETTQSADTEYAAERSSELAAEDFLEDTGEDIQTATDDEIAAWLEEKQLSEAEQVTQTDKESKEEKTEEEAAENLQAEQEKVLEAVTQKLVASPEGMEFFLIRLDETTYQVEIRQPHAVDDVEISNMIGIFEYNMDTDALKKMNPITGEYEIYGDAL